MPIARFHDFSGMLQVKTSRFLRPTNELTRVINVQADIIGALQKRLGYSVFDSTVEASAEIRGITAYNRIGGTNRIFVAVESGGSNVIRQSSGSGWNNVIAGLTLSAKIEFATFINELFIVGFNETNRTYETSRNVDNLTATTTNNLSNAPNARLVKVYRQRLYMLNTNSNTSEVRYSSVPTSGAITWPTANQFEVRTDDGDEIVGVGEFANRLVVFKQNSMHEWNESSVIQVSNIGTNSHRSIVEYGGLLFFFSNSKNKKGFYVYSGGRPKLLSGKIQEWVDGIADSTLADMVGFQKGDNIIWYVGTITLNTDIGTETFSNSGIVYNMSTNTWGVFQYADTFRCATEFAVSGALRPYLGTNDGDVHQMAIPGDTVYSDNGTAIAALFRTTKIDFGASESEKRVSKSIFFAQSAQGLQVRVRADDGKWESIGQLKKPVNELKGLNSKGYYFEFEGSESSVNQPFIFEGFSLSLDTNTVFS